MQQQEFDAKGITNDCNLKKASESEKNSRNQFVDSQTINTNPRSKKNSNENNNIDKYDTEQSPMSFQLQQNKEPNEMKLNQPTDYTFKEVFLKKLNEKQLTFLNDEEFYNNDTSKKKKENRVDFSKMNKSKDLKDLISKDKSMNPKFKILLNEFKQEEDRMTMSNLNIRNIAEYVRKNKSNLDLDKLCNEKKSQL